MDDTEETVNYQELSWVTGRTRPKSFPASEIGFTLSPSPELIAELKAEQLAVAPCNKIYFFR